MLLAIIARALGISRGRAEEDREIVRGQIEGKQHSRRARGAKRRRRRAPNAPPFFNCLLLALTEREEAA